MMTQKTQQLDLPFSNGHFYEIPKNMPGRVNVDDFVFFEYPEDFRSDDYVVVASTQDTSGDPAYQYLKRIGPLAKSVEIPHVLYGAHGQLLVMPLRDSSLPTYYSRLNRGSTYVIPSGHHGRGARIEMRRHGVLTSGI